MKVIYARQKLPKSVFLAGPTPRDKQTPSWRPEAISLFREFGFNGTVMVPENEHGKEFNEKVDYDDQVDWEWEGLNTATCVLFWVPREMTTMLALTTNVEYGMIMSGTLRVASIGWPKDAPKNRYLSRLADLKCDVVHHTLRDTVIGAIAACDDPYEVARA